MRRTKYVLLEKCAFPDRAETGGGSRFERTVMAGAGRINGAIGVTAELDRGLESAPCGGTAELVLYFSIVSSNAHSHRKIIMF